MGGAGGEIGGLRGLRRRAEQALAEGREDLAAVDSTELVHELRVHQIELEMQNDELQRAQCALEASRDRYQSLYERAPIGYVTCDPQGRIERANARARSVLGAASDELAGVSLPGFSGEQHMDELHLLFRRLLSSRDVESCELRLVGRDGRVRDVRIDGRGEFDATGVLRSVLLCIADVGVRKRAEAHAQALGNVVEQSPAWVLLTDSSGIIQYVNPAFLEAKGCAAEYVIGKSPRMLKSGDDDAALYQQLWAAICSRDTWRGDVTNQRGDGTTHRELVSISPIKDRSGAISHFVAVQIDDTERRISEMKLRASEERFRSITEAASDPIVVVNAQARIAMWNPAATRFFVREESEVRGKSVDEVMIPVDREAFAVDLERFIATGEGPLGQSKVDITLRTRRGDDVPVELSLSRAARDGEWHATLILNDLTARKRRESEQARLANLDSLGVLAGGIAHDFNNLLTGVLANLSFARRYIPMDGELPKILGDAERAARRAGSLTRQLLTFAKGGAPVKEEIDLRSLIEATTSFALRGSNVARALEFADDLWLVSADEGQLGQAIQSLTMNARQAMPDGGTIRIGVANERIEADTVSTLAPGAYVRISVEDEGTGIAKEQLARVFEPYFTTKKGGSGLGLATAFSIIQSHGGKLEATSEVGTGTTVVAHLPALPDSRGAERPAASVAPYRGTARVLVMDDEDLVRTIAQRSLSRAGFDVVTAADGRAAIERFREARAAGAPFDVVMLDLTVPGGMGGLETLAELRRLDPDVRAVVSSGYAEDPVMANHKAHGFVAVVPKPYGAKALPDAVNGVLGRGQDE